MAEFTQKEIDKIEEIASRYPERLAATLPALWVAQNKFGHVEPEVQKLVAETLGVPESHVHGVASFYTQYYKEKKGKHVLDVCTCLSCQICGGYDILEYLEDKLGIKKGETTEDGMFTIQEVECLGACGYAPMLQVTNGNYINNLTKEKVDKLVEDLKKGVDPEFESMPMPEIKSTQQS